MSLPMSHDLETRPEEEFNLIIFNSLVISTQHQGDFSIYLILTSKDYSSRILCEFSHKICLN